MLVLPPQTPDRLRELMTVGNALLDFPHYRACLMAFDAFAAQLPIVTLPGKLTVERYALGFYCKTGIMDLVATSTEEYVRLAARLGKDPDFRRHIQDSMRAAKHLLFESQETVREFERFVEEAVVLRGKSRT